MLYARVTHASQAYRLRAEMISAGMTHGQGVEATTEVRVGEDATIFFCDMPALADVVPLAEMPGDGQEIPERLRVIVTGLKVPKPGIYNVRARISSNGDMRFIPIEEQEPVFVRAW